MNLPRTQRNLGFDGRTFLTEEEWQTYRRRKPVRYIREPYFEVCEVCRLPANEENPFQNAHKIGFDLGIVQLALTPEFLDGRRNIVTAHRKICNRAAELDITQSMVFLLSIGVTELPMFLSQEVLFLWEKLKLAV